MRKILKFLLLAVSLTPCLLYSQSEKLRNLPYIDQRRIHFGFMLGVHTQDIEFVHNGIVSEDGSQWVAEIPGFSPGFAVGLVGDYAFTENLSLRLTPSMYFGSKYIKMVDLNTGEKENQDIKSNYLMVPLSLKYAARRVNNYRPYLIAGASAGLDLSKRKDTPILLKRFDTYIEVGLGCDLYLPFFKLIPELKFSFGMLDILQHNRDDLRDKTMIRYSEGISKATSRMVVLSFYFE